MFLSGVKEKISLFLVCVVLFSAILSPSVQVQAAAFPAVEYSAWELLQWLLLTLGVTVGGDAAAHQLSDDDMFGLIIDSMNEYMPGFGDDVEEIVISANNAASLYMLNQLVITQSIWDNMVGWARSMFVSSSNIVITGGNINMELKSVQDIVDVFTLVSGYSFTEQQIEDYIVPFLDERDDSSIPISMFYFYDGDSDHYCGLMFASDGSVIYPTIRKVPSVTGRVNYYYVEAGVMFRYILWSDSSLSFYSPHTDSSFISLAADVSATVYWRTPLIGSEYKVEVEVDAHIDSGFRSDVLDEDLVLVTPGTTVVDGELVGDITLPIPADLADVLTDVLNGTKAITDALEDADIYPTTKDPDAVVDAQAKVEASTKPIDQYRLPLADLFPFCLPFDAANFLACLQASPQAPEFTWKFPVGYQNGVIVYKDYTVSLKSLDKVAFWIRRFELLAFIVGLIVQTRDKFIRG